MSDTNNVYINKWDSSFSFLMAMIGAAVGLGNIWRFSYVLYSNGGGSFLIPYFIAIAILGIPFLILEYGVGFKFKDSLANILKRFNPYFEYIGWFIAFIVFLVLTYYVIIVAWDVIYLLLSLTKGWGMNPDAYFNNNIIVGTNNFDYILTPVIPTLIITVLIWALIWFISHRDLDSGLSKVVKVIIPSLFIIMFMVGIYAFTLPGQYLGIETLLTPKWDLLFTVDIWLAAFAQIVFSMSIGQAIAVTYSSYLPNNTKLINNAFIVAIANSSFELFTSLVVFSILGFMSFNTGVSVTEIATSGTGLIFVVFPTIFNIMGDISYIIAPIFFLAVFFAGLSTALAYIEPLALGINRKFGLPRKTCVSIVCSLGVILSLVYTTGAGNYILTIADSFINEFGVLLAIVMQVLVFGWYYGAEKLLEVLNENGRIKVGKTWLLIIKYIQPILISIMWISGIIGLIGSGKTNDLIIEVVIAIIMFGFPLIFTILPKKDITKH